MPNGKKILSKKDLIDPEELLLQAVQSGLEAGYSDINDQDISKAPNAVEWMIGAKYLNVKPYPKQLQDIIHAFSAACYFCSDTDYLVDIPKDAAIGDILERTQLMKNGKCPKCKRKVMEMRYEWCLDPANTYEGYIKPAPPNEICCIKGQRCVVGSTLVRSRYRGLVPIKTVEVGEQLWTPRGWKTVRKTWRFKNKPTRRVTLRGGLSLRGGYQHRVLVMTPEGSLKFRRYENLKVGDWVACQTVKESDTGETELPNPSYKPGKHATNRQSPIIPKHLTADLARVLGYLVSEGSCTSDYVLKFHNTDPKLHKDYCRSFFNSFGIEPSNPWGDSEACSVEVQSFLEQLGLNKSTCHHKKLPWVILRAPDSLKWEFLLALYEGDDSLSAEKLRYHTTSRRLAKSLQLLLNSLGIDSVINKWWTKPGSGSPNENFVPSRLYEVKISKGPHIVRFCTSIPWVATKSIQCASQLIGLYCNRRDREFLPNCLPHVDSLRDEIFRKEFVEVVIPESNRCKSYTRTHQKPVYSEQVRGSVRPVLEQNERLSTISLRKLASELGVSKLPKELRLILKRGYYFRQVESIKESEPADLYDLTIDGHTYWSQGIVSHNSGKSIQTAMITTYVFHRYLKLPNPSRWFRLLKRQVLHATFVSVTATQAWENLWQPVSDLIDESPWFRQYHDFLDSEGERLGMELWSKKDTYLWYGHKRLAATFRPADVRSLRGRTRFLSAVDELGWFGTSKQGSAKVKADGDGTWRALDRSLATVRNAANRKRKTHPSTPDGYMITISSPSAATDPIMRRYYKAPKSPRVYAILQPTWAANPDFTEESLREQEGDVNEIEFQCVDPATFVSTDKGLQRIGDLCPRYGAQEVSGVRVNSHKGLFLASHAIRNKPSRTLEVETKHGLRVICTYDQEFLAVFADLSIKWVQAKNLDEGTHLVVVSTVEWPKELPHWNFAPDYRPAQEQIKLPHCMTKDLARFLGYHASAGSLSRTNYCLKFGMTDKNVTLDYLRLFNKLFGLNRKLAKEWHELSTKWSYEVSLTRKDVYEWLHVIGAQGNSHTKQIPWVVLQSPKEFVVEFLKGLFWEGNGSAVITLELASEELIRQTQILLLQFNILSAVNPSKGGHRLVISGPNRDKFIDTIGFISDSKTDFQAAGSAKQHSLPLNITNTSRNGSTPRTSEIKHHLLGELSDDYITSPVKSVVQGPIIDTCDFSVPETKRFLGNGLVLHNCDFGCKPPYSDSPWWNSENQLMGLCRTDPHEQRLWSYSKSHEPDPLSAKWEWIHSKLNIVGADRQTPRVLALDCGEKNNSFSWLAAHYRKDINTVIVDDLGELAPRQGERVHFGNMWEHLILPAVQQFRFLHVVWDHWESSTYVSDLRTKHKVRAEQYTACRADARGLLSDMNNSLISLPQPECPINELPPADPVACSRFPKAHLLLQIMTVRDSGGVPSKPQGGTDDTFRCLLLAHTFLRANESEYGRFSRYSGTRTVGLGSRGRGGGGIITGAGGTGIAIGSRRR